MPLECRSGQFELRLVSPLLGGGQWKPDEAKARTTYPSGC